jgi:hypothetical protein
LKVVALVGAHAALAGRRGKQEVCSALYALLLLARRGAERTSPQGEKPCDQMATAFQAPLIAKSREEQKLRSLRDCRRENTASGAAEDPR